MKNVSRNKVDIKDEAALNRELDNIRFLLEQLKYFYGNGSPEGVIIADKGSIYINREGGSSTTLYVKETGIQSNTGWVAK